MNKDRDLTTGSSVKLIFSFAFSMMMGNIFQQLYTVVDSIIIGKKIGPLGLAAIGGTDWLIFLVNGFLIGLIQGFSVILGKKFGEKDEESFDRYYKKAWLLCLIIAVLFVIVLLSASGILLMASSFGQLIMRVLCALVVTAIVGYSGIFYGEISAWILADVILIVAYFREIKKVQSIQD